MPNIRNFRELRVYRTAFQLAVRIYHLTKSFPAEERFSLVDQIRRSSRGVCTNLAEAWRKKTLPCALREKITDSEGEADETRVWLEFSLAFGYINQDLFSELDLKYDLVLGQLVTMRSNPEKWKVG